MFDATGFTSVSGARFAVSIASGSFIFYDRNCDVSWVLSFTCALLKVFCAGPVIYLGTVVGFMAVAKIMLTTLGS